MPGEPPIGGFFGSRSEWDSVKGTSAMSVQVTLNEEGGREFRPWQE